MGLLVGKEELLGAQAVRAESVWDQLRGVTCPGAPSEGWDGGAGAALGVLGSACSSHPIPAREFSRCFGMWFETGGNYESHPAAGIRARSAKSSSG